MINNAKQKTTTRGNDIKVLELNHGVSKTAFSINEITIRDRSENAYIATRAKDSLTAFIHAKQKARNAVAYKTFVSPEADHDSS